MKKEKCLIGFSIPSIPIQSVLRLNLLDQMGKTARNALTLVIAPPGYGKTTLLGQWVSQCSIPCVWVTLHEEDNDLRNFAANLRLAMEEIFEQFPETITIDNSKPLIVVDAPQEFTKIIDYLSALPVDLAFILDDYHIISNPKVNEVLRYIIRHLPHIHLLIASRTIPPLDIACLRVKGQLLEIYTNSLRFTTYESKEFFCKGGIELSEEDIECLDYRTEGWVAALRLILLRLQSMSKEQIPGFIATLNARDSYIWDYLSEEILDQLPPLIRKFMIETSYLHNQSSKLCDEVLGRNDSRVCLDYLERSNLVIPIDYQRLWYRYPHLLADYLSKVLEREMGIEKIIELHNKASYWYERHGDYSAAANHALGAKDAERAWQLLYKRQERLNPAEDLTWRNEFMEFPKEVILSQPDLCLSAAWCSVLAQEIDNAILPLQFAEQTFGYLGDATGLGRVYTLRAFINRYLGESRDAIIQAKRALHFLPDESTMDRAEALYILGMTYSDLGRIKVSEQLVEQARKTLRDGDNECLAHMMTASIARVKAKHGKLRKSEELYKQVISFSDYWICNQTSATYIFLGRLYYEWNKLDLAKEYLTKGIDEQKTMTGKNYVQLGYATLAKLLSVKGKESEARLTLDKAASCANTRNNWNLSHFIKALDARLALRHGNLNSAQLWLRTIRPLPINDEVSFKRLYEHLTLIRLLLAEDRESKRQEHYDEVQNRLAILLLQAKDDERISDVIEIRILQALSLFEHESYEQALDALEPSLVTAEPEGYVRIFIDEGEPMAKLLMWASSNNIHKGYVEHLLDELNSSSEIANPYLCQNVIINSLSRREVEVLRLIAQGLTTSEMVETLAISIHTVRTHIKTILSKLEVHSRLQAVEKARSMGLL